MTKANKKLFLVGSVLHLLDYASTYLGVKKFGAREQNPLLKALVHKDKWGYLFVIKSAAIAGIWLSARRLASSQADSHLGQKEAKKYLIVNSVVVGAVVLNNTYQISKQFRHDKKGI